GHGAAGDEKIAGGFGFSCRPEAHADCGGDGDEGEGEDPRIDCGENWDHLSGLPAAASSSSRAMERRMKTQAMAQTNGKKRTPRISQVRVNPQMRLAISSGRK